MSSISSRFSSLTSHSTTTYQPPKPNYNSPKLVQEPMSPPSPSRDFSRVAHPFASSSYASAQGGAAPYGKQCQQSDYFSHGHAHARARRTSEFGLMYHSHDLERPFRGAASEGPGSLEAAVQQRQRSSTVGSQLSMPSNFGLHDDFLPSPNPFKSQFDDSDDDEERLAHLSFSGVSTRARLAAIGTASRLFKPKRHSRTTSNTVGPKSAEQLVNAFVQAEKQRDSPTSRPSTSDGMSPLPRQAVFGHRPSPSELGLLSKVGRSRTVDPVDRDLILALQGGSLGRRSKPDDKKKATPKQPDKRRSSRASQESLGASAFHSCGRAPWMDPPPYCAPNEPETGPNETLRKSQSMSTLRFDTSRRPSNTSMPPRTTCQPVPEHAASSAQSADQSAWESMHSSPPSTVSDHASISSYGRVTRTQAALNSPPRKSMNKAQRLPPQKPPPKFGLPPPPPSKNPDSATYAQTSKSSKSSFEDAQSSPGSGSDSAGHGARSPVLLKRTSSKPRSLPRQAEQASTFSSSRSRFLQSDSQVVLDIGGTTFVTLISTLQGAHGDSPRLFELLKCQQDGHIASSADNALCGNTQLTRRKRVDTSNRKGIHERSDSDQSTQSSQSQDSVKTAGELSGELFHSPTMDLAVEASGSASSISLSASGSSSVPLTDSETSTRRTSDSSDASSWSKDASEVVAAAINVHAKEMSTKEQASNWTADNAYSRRCAAQTQAPVAPSPALRIFLDRNGDLYRDVLDILRNRKLPYRLQASCIISQSSRGSQDEHRDAGVAALQLQLRCRLHEVKDEAEWLGYRSIVDMCQAEIALV